MLQYFFINGNKMFHASLIVVAWYTFRSSATAAFRCKGGISYTVLRKNATCDWPKPRQHCGIETYDMGKRANRFTHGVVLETYARFVTESYAPACPEAIEHPSFVSPYSVVRSVFSRGTGRSRAWKRLSPVAMKMIASWPRSRFA